MTDPAPVTRPKRDRIEIFAEILQLCKKPMAKTRILYKTNISYPALLSQLVQLQKMGMLTHTAETKKFATTDKGAEFPEKYSALKKHLD